MFGEAKNPNNIAMKIMPINIRTMFMKPRLFIFNIVTYCKRKISHKWDCGGFLFRWLKVKGLGYAEAFYFINFIT